MGLIAANGRRIFVPSECHLGTPRVPGYKPGDREIRILLRKRDPPTKHQVAFNDDTPPADTRGQPSCTGRHLTFGLRRALWDDCRSK